MEIRPPLLIEATAGRRRSLRRIWIWAVALLLAIGAAAFYFLQAGDAQQRSGRRALDASRATPVVAAAAKSGDVNVYLNGLGTATPLKTVTVRSRVDGELVRVLFKEGQVVKAGDLLAEIDQRPYLVQLTQAEGQMARDQALLANARIDLDRYRTLFKQDSIAEQQVATQEALVHQYEGTVKTDQGQVDNARLQLAYSRITAPISGRLGLRLVDQGNIVHASDTNGLVVITQLQPITALFTIPQDNLPEVLKRMRAESRIPVQAYDRDQKTRLAEGVLLSMDNQIDPATGTVKLKAQFPNDDHSLFPNQFVNVRMLIDTRHDATIVPSAAVQRSALGTFVYVVKSDNTAALRKVDVGVSEGDNVTINAGVAPGELVVVEGVDRLRDGAKVELPGPAGAAAPAGDRAASKGGGRRRKNDQ